MRSLFNSSQDKSEKGQLKSPYCSIVVLCLIIAGETVWSVNKWMLSIEGRVVIPHSPPIPDFTTALVVLFASFYVFNIEYQVEAATTLEFVQR